MKEGLVTLLARKTEESRINALREVNACHTLLEVVSQAEKQAEYKIKLPSALTEPVASSAKEAVSTNHVAAVGIARKAAAARAEVLTTAKDALKRELTRRTTASENARQKVKQVKYETGNALEQAEAKLNRAMDSAEADKHPDLPASPGFGETVGKGGMTSCLGIVAVIMIALTSNMYHYSNMICYVALFMIGGIVVVPVTIYIHHAIKCGGTVGTAQSKANEQLQAAQSTYEQQIEAANSALEVDLPQAEEAVKLAESRQSKAEAAFKLLKGYS